VEIYMQLRNPAVMRRPLEGAEAAAFCQTLRENPRWQHLDYEPEVSEALRGWARETATGFRHIIDARLAFTLLHHGVTRFATANVRDLEDFGFERVWNPVAGPPGTEPPACG
jgi:hypothetical protein